MGLKLSRSAISDLSVRPCVPTDCPEHAQEHYPTNVKPCMHQSVPSMHKSVPSMQRLVQNPQL